MHIAKQSLNLLMTLAVSSAATVPAYANNGNTATASSSSATNDEIIRSIRLIQDMNYIPGLSSDELANYKGLVGRVSENLSSTLSSSATGKSPTPFQFNSMLSEYIDFLALTQKALDRIREDGDVFSRLDVPFSGIVAAMTAFHFLIGTKSAAVAIEEFKFFRSPIEASSKLGRFATRTGRVAAIASAVTVATAFIAWFGFDFFSYTRHIQTTVDRKNQDEERRVVFEHLAKVVAAELASLRAMAAAIN